MSQMTLIAQMEDIARKTMAYILFLIKKKNKQSKTKQTLQISLWEENQ